ncbi:MAG TPA: hypothetical protein EYG85_02760 [Crocinitomix sp.]|nr:hypothetical protein [Crocinitomix sp.]
MKKVLLIVLLLGITSLTFSQKTTEYLSVKVQYGLKVSGFVTDIWVDIGDSGRHSLSGEITNKDGVVEINGKKYTSEIDLLNYFGSIGWEVYSVRKVKILNEEYDLYLLVKKTE